MFRNSTTIAAVSAAIILGSMLGNAGAVVKSGPAGYANGQCKSAFETVMGSSQEHAKVMWTQTVVGKFGTKWAHWVGANSKSVTPINSGGTTMYQAKGKPCYYEPVL